MQFQEIVEAQRHLIDSQRWVGEDDVVLGAGVLTTLGSRERIVVLNSGAFVQVKVEDGDLHQIRVVVESR